MAVRESGIEMKIQLALSNRLFCEGIKKLASDAGIFATFNSSHANPADFDADIVLFDARKDICLLLDTHPDARFVLVDTGLKETDLACLLLCYHISGILPQETDTASFSKAMKVIYDGDIWIDQKHLKILIKKGRALPESFGIKGLSSKDLKIVELITLGHKNREIADQMCLSEVTIKAHISRIFKMLKSILGGY